MNARTLGSNGNVVRIH